MTDPNDRLAKLEGRVETLESWRGGIDVLNAQRAAELQYFKERFDGLESTMGKKFDHMEKSIDRRLAPINKIAWVIGSTILVSFVGVVINFIVRGGFNVGG